MDAPAAQLAGGVWRAVFFREVRSALVNRYFQVFFTLALGGGVAAVTLSEAPEAVPFFILQVSLYFGSFFALLSGVGSARAESEEWPFLFAQPVSRPGFVVTKFVALASLFSGVLALLFVPALVVGSSQAALLHLYLHSLGLVAVFGSLGLSIGILAQDRVQALVLAVSVWLFLLVGVDLAALLLAQSPEIQKRPDLWAGLLMANPLDAFRIQALFAFEQIPLEGANHSPLAAWWLRHLDLWFVIVSAAWTAGLLLLASFRFERGET